MKKVLAFLLVSIMLFPATAFADENIVSSMRMESIKQVNDDSDIMPLYDYFDILSVGLSIDENGHASWDGSATALGCNIRIKLYLQRSNNQLLWDDISGAIKTVYESGAMGYTKNLAKEDYFYRAKLVAEILDSSNNVLESVTLYSNVKRY